MAQADAMFALRPTHDSLPFRAEGSLDRWQRVKRSENLSLIVFGPARRSISHRGNEFSPDPRDRLARSSPFSSSSPRKWRGTCTRSRSSRTCHLAFREIQFPSIDKAVILILIPFLLRRWISFKRVVPVYLQIPTAWKTWTRSNRSVSEFHSVGLKFIIRKCGVERVCTARNGFHGIFSATINFSVINRPINSDSVSCFNGARA